MKLGEDICIDQVNISTCVICFTSQSILKLWYLERETGTIHAVEFGFFTFSLLLFKYINNAYFGIE